jgi:hypothetical protein
MSCSLLGHYDRRDLLKIHLIPSTIRNHPGKSVNIRKVVLANMNHGGGLKSSRPDASEAALVFNFGNIELKYGA